MSKDLKKVRDKARKILTGEHFRQREQKYKSPEEGRAWLLKNSKEFSMSAKESTERMQLILAGIFFKVVFHFKEKCHNKKLSKVRRHSL